MAETGYTGSPRLVRGALVQLAEDVIGVTPNVIPFQYNPETLTRTLTPWNPFEVDQTGRGQVAPTAQPFDPKETITLVIEFDAADVDEDVFDVPEKMGDLHRLGRHITVYHNEGDLALTASDWFKGNPDRLGSEGPARPHDLHRKVKMVDCHAVADIQHSYYHEVDIVAKDIASILAGTAPTQRRDLSANRFAIIEP